MDLIDATFDFKGWRFRAPFYCMSCSRPIDVRQWGFCRGCGSCDVGRPTGPIAPWPQWYAGPCDLIDPFSNPFLPASDRLKPRKELSLDDYDRTIVKPAAAWRAEFLSQTD